MFRCHAALYCGWLSVILTPYTTNVFCAVVEQPPAADAKDVSSVNAEFVAAALNPFWRAREIREPIFFIEGTGSGRPIGNLLFKPTEVVSVTSGTRETVFEPGRDFDVNLDAATISLPAGSRIPVTTREHLYPLMNSSLPKIARKSGDRTRGIFFDEGPAYHKLQTSITYLLEPGQWKGPTPEFAGRTLPKTVAKLRARQPLKLVLCGDSITQGLNSSLVTKALPHFPPYGQLTALGLESHFGSRVTLVNLAVDGTTSKDGLQLAKKERISAEAPDFVIIAFGMNDVYNRHDAAKFKANIGGMIDEMRKNSPDAEFILVAPMVANAERGIPLDKFPQYRDALAELSGPGVALADVTSIWEELRKRKTFYDLTGNGVNHPNDFGHLVYAQTILAMLIETPK